MFGQFLDKYNAAKDLPIFQGLSWLELQRIVRKSQFRNFRKGELIVKEGEESSGFFCLISGRLRAFTLNKTGKKENVEFIHRGMYFGIISLLTGENHSLNFETINDSIVLHIERDEFLNILKDIPKLSIEISQSLSRRIRSKVKNEKMIFESKIISVYSPVAETGSSSYAVNLGLSLKRETDKKVLFINIDSKRAFDRQMQENHEEEASPQWKEASTHYLHEIVDSEQKVLDAVIRDELPIDVLNVVFDETYPDLVEQISRFVSMFVNTYHYIIVDLPNEMNDLVVKTLGQSDVVHIVTIDREQDLTLTRIILDRLQDRFKEGFDEEKVRVIISGVYQRVLDDAQVRTVLNYDVFSSLPSIDLSELTDITVTHNLTLLKAGEKSKYGLCVRRIARQIGDVSVGIVLGGGAALGLAHIGVIKVLEEENIPIDIIIGSSMGALIGSIWALGANAKMLEQYAREFSRTQDLMKLVDPILPWSGLVGGKAIRRWLKSKLADHQFIDVKIPFKCIAYDLNHRQDLVLESGSLVDAVHQSIAIPGIIKPIINKKQLIIDGGVMNPLPTNVLVSQGVKKILAVNVLQSPQHIAAGHDIHERRIQADLAVPFSKKPFHYLSVRWHQTINRFMSRNISNTIVQTLQASEYIIASQSGNHADVMISPDLTGIDWFELYRVDDLIRMGEEAARRELAAIKELTNV